jgi:hypothetical protein
MKTIEPGQFYSQPAEIHPYMGYYDLVSVSVCDCEGRAGKDYAILSGLVMNGVCYANNHYNSNYYMRGYGPDNNIFHFEKMEFDQAKTEEPE